MYKLKQQEKHITNSLVSGLHIVKLIVKLNIEVGNQNKLKSKKKNCFSYKTKPQNQYKCILQF